VYCNIYYIYYTSKKQALVGARIMETKLFESHNNPLTASADLDLFAVRFLFYFFFTMSGFII